MAIQRRLNARRTRIAPGAEPSSNPLVLSNSLLCRSGAHNCRVIHVPQREGRVYSLGYRGTV